MAAAIEGAQVDFDTASRIESRYLAGLITGSNSKNMIQAFFFDLSRHYAVAPCGPGRRTPVPADQGGRPRRGDDGRRYRCAPLRPLGAWRSCSRTSPRSRPTRARPTARRSWPRPSSAARWTRRRRPRSSTGSLRPTEANDFKGCDLVIEAVFEDPTLKAKVFGEIQDIVNPDALLCSNTSTLPITELAEGVNRPEDFIGLHFFSPVDKMPLVEIIRGARPPTRPSQGARRGDGDPQDPDRGQRQPWLLHQPGHRHDGQRGPRDARRGGAPDVRGAGRDPGRLPGRDAAALRPAQHGADGQDRQATADGRGRTTSRTRGPPWWTP